MRTRTGVALGALLLLALGAGCRAPGPPGPPGAGGGAAQALERRAESRAVVQAVLESLATPGVERLVLDPEASAGWPLQEGAAPFALGVGTDTIRDFERRPGGRLPVDLDAGVPIAWLTDAESRALAEEDSVSGSCQPRWDALHRRF